MNGLQSLMQGAPTQRPQQPQPQQAPAMPNDPRMGAAMGLVDDSVEKFKLDPQTEALMLKNQALDLLKAADNVGKMNVPQQDTSIQEQTTQGIAGMLQSLAPGMQQRGQQMQRSQARQMLGGGAPARPPMPQQNMARPPMGGMPTMGAPNMARMADGGIVGYQEGGFLGKIKEMDTKLNAGADASQNERMARGRRMSDYNVLADPYNSAMNIMYDTGIAGALQKLTGYESQLDKPAEEDPTAKQLKNFMAVQDAFKARKAAGAGEEELRRIMEDLNSYTNVVPNIEADAARARGGMARGGIIGYKTGGRAEQQRQAGAAYAARQAEADEVANLQALRNRKYVELITQGYTPEQARARASEGADLPYAMLNREAQGGDVGGIAQAAYRLRNPAPTDAEFMPEGSSVMGGMGDAVETTETPVVTPVTAPAARQEFTPDALDLLTEEKLKAALNADPNAVATTRGDRLRELTGFDDLMARRIESEKAVRDQKESRLSPEETRKRRFRAGLAGLAEQGLGGFGAGRTSEMDKIAAERLGIEETSLADLNSLIAEKREMGMSQFEAENSARAEIQASTDNAATVAGRRGDTRRTAYATSQENALNRASNERVAALQVAGSNETDLVRRLNIRMKEIKAANPELSETEIASRAMNMVEQQETSAALARVGIQASQQDFAKYEGAARIVIERITSDIKWATLSTAEQQAAYQTALDAEMENIERVLKGTPSTGGSSTGPAVGTESGGFRFKGGDPADRNNWQEL